MTVKEIQAELFTLQDAEYRDFQSKLIPTSQNQNFIGVRTPQLKELAKTLCSKEHYEQTQNFLDILPHEYFDEYQLHAFILEHEKDFSKCLEQTERFLQYVDNWATCDQLNPKAFKKNRKELLPHIDRWLNSSHCYTIRFAIKLLMQHFLDNDFDVSLMKKVAGVKSQEYYVNMMRAWYFATALAKQYDHAVSFLEQRQLDAWTHAKTIQKACESLRISAEQKEYLRSLK